MGVAIASNSADQSQGRIIGHALCPLTEWEGWKENMWVKIMTLGRKAVRYNHHDLVRNIFLLERTSQ